MWRNILSSSLGLPLDRDAILSDVMDLEVIRPMSLLAHKLVYLVPGEETYFCSIQIVGFIRSVILCAFAFRISHYQKSTSGRTDCLKIQLQ
jgi:hypothetical protein